MHEALSLIRSLFILLKEEPVILASPQDADYFRAKRKHAFITQPSTPVEPVITVPVPSEAAAPRSSTDVAPSAPDSGETRLISEIYHAPLGFVNFDSARRSQAEAKRSDRRGPAPSGEGEEEDRFGKVAASQNSKNLTVRGIHAPALSASNISSGASVPLKALSEEPIVPPQYPLSSSSSILNSEPPQNIRDQTIKSAKSNSKTSLSTHSEIRAILKKIAPELAILDDIPNDAAAKHIATRWKTKNKSAPISVLSCGELPQHKALLTEIVLALEVYFGNAKLIDADSIEQEKQWQAFLSTQELKLVIACDATLWQLHHLRQFYKEIPVQGTRMLANIPLFLLPDLSLYLKDPLLKRSLWKALCQKLPLS